MIEKYKKMMQSIYKYRDKESIEETLFEISVYDMKEKLETYLEKHKNIGTGEYLKNKIEKENSEDVKNERMLLGQKTILNGKLKSVTTSINSLFLEIDLSFSNSSDLTEITIFKDIDSDEFYSEVIIIKNNGKNRTVMGTLNEFDPLFFEMYSEDIANIFRSLEEKNDLLENNLDDGIFDDIRFTDGFINGRMQINREGKVEVFLENFVFKNSDFATLQELKDIKAAINYIEEHWDLFLKKVSINKLSLPFAIQRIVEGESKKPPKVKKKQLPN